MVENIGENPEFFLTLWKLQKKSSAEKKKLQSKNCSTKLQTDPINTQKNVVKFSYRLPFYYLGENI